MKRALIHEGARPRSPKARDTSLLSGWRVGYAEADITPTADRCMMAGFSRERITQSALQPLIAQVLTIRDARGRMGVLVTADLIGFSRTTVELIRRHAGALYNLRPESILLAASHTHWGPAFGFNVNLTCGAANVWYICAVEHKILDLIGAALKQMHPADVAFTELETRIGANRRTFDRKGNHLWLPNLKGSYDTHTPVLRIQISAAGQSRGQAAGNRPKEIVVVGHACHPTSSGRIDRWTPDYPGYMREHLRRALGRQSRAMFVMGCGADAKVTHVEEKTGEIAFSADPKHSRAAGQRLAQAVLDQLAKVQPVRLGAALECRTVTGELSLEKPMSVAAMTKLAYDPQRDFHTACWARQMLDTPDPRRSWRFDVQAWKLGGRLTLLALENEVCSPLGPLARALIRTELGMTIAYANATTCYIPSRKIRIEGGYEGRDSHISCQLPAPFTRKVEREFLAIVHKAVNQLA